MNPLYEEYNGLLDVIKLPWLGGSLDLVARPTTSQWAFKVKRRQFLIEVRARALIISASNLSLVIIIIAENVFK